MPVKVANTFFFFGHDENHQITPAALGGATISVRLLLTKKLKILSKRFVCIVFERKRFLFYFQQDFFDSLYQVVGKVMVVEKILYSFSLYTRFLFFNKCNYVKGLKREWGGLYPAVGHILE